MLCQFKSTLTTFECTADVIELKSCSDSDIVIILTENGILPKDIHETNFSICSAHLSFYLKQNATRYRRKLCQMPPSINAHPQTEMCQDFQNPPRRGQKATRSTRGLTFNDVISIQNTTGLILPIGTPACTRCRIKVHESKESICEADEVPLEEIQIINNTTSRDSFEKEKYPIQKEGKQEDDIQSIFTETTDEQFDFSQESMNSQKSYVRAEHLECLNEFLKCFEEDIFSENDRRRWDSYSDRAKTRYASRFTAILEKIVLVIFPYDLEEIMKVISSHQDVEITEQSQSHVLPEGNFGPLVEFYKSSKTWQQQRQILSLMTAMPYGKLVKHIPSLTEYRYYAAKSHAGQVGPGLPVTDKELHRNRINPERLDCFLEFITSSHVIRDLPYGEKKMRLSDGTIHYTPNVVRCMGSSDIISQYKLYCDENNMCALGDSTMYKILADCSASVRKSLEGLDYFVAEGGRAFVVLQDVIDELLHLQILNQQQHCHYGKLLTQAKHYLKTDFKIHVSTVSEVADHCQVYALSDATNNKFSSSCSHSHQLLCESCEQVRETVESLQKTVETATLPGHDQLLHDLCFKFTQASTSLTSLKTHFVRCKNQDMAKNNIFQQMNNNEVLLVCDWAMKYLPKKYREGQTDWFAKRGIPWHVTVAFTRLNDNIHSLGFIHLFNGQTPQDSQTTSAVILDVIQSLKTIKESTKIHIWSDNAGCYKSTEMMAHLFQNGSVISYNFCEAQNGKGACDRTAASIKSGIRRYINQGHDVLTALSMKEAIKKSLKNVHYRVCVVEANSSKKKTSISKAIPSISTYSNFVFNEDGIRVWKAYNIGQGHLIPRSDIPAMEHQPLAVLSTADNTVLFHQIRSNTQNRERALTCTNDGCVSTFATNEELTDHLLIGNCQVQYSLQSSTKSDISKIKYLEKLEASGVLTIDITVNTQSVSTTDAALPQGWALKEDRKVKRFNNNQRDFLTDKFNKGEKSGKKEDPNVVAESMLIEKNADGSRRFTYDEILTAQQITSFFSRMFRKSNKVEEALRESVISDLQRQIMEN